MYKFYFTILLLLFVSCKQEISYQKLAHDLIVKTIISKPIGKNKTEFLNIYQAYSDFFISHSQSDYMLNEDHVSIVTLNSDNHYYFRTTFLNDTCVSVGSFFYDKIDTSLFLAIKNVIEQEYGFAEESHKNETGGHLSFNANINVYDWNLNGIRTNLEFDIDSTNLNFFSENVAKKNRAERVVLTKIPTINPQLLRKPNIVIPDSIKNKFPNFKSRYVYEVKIDTSGRICNYSLKYGDTILNKFINFKFEDYLFKPAVNKYGKHISSKLMIPIKIDFTIDSTQIK